MWPASRNVDRYHTTFDHDGLISNAGLIVNATLMSASVSRTSSHVGFAPVHPIRVA